MSSVTVRYEQAVYGSFPFWDKGYAVLARSPGCRDEWVADLRAVCQRYGERPAGAADAGGLIVLRLPSGPWTIIAPRSQGNDDRGRPGAVAFHAIFLSGADYRRVGGFPFVFAPLFRNDWTAETKTLASGSFTVHDVIDSAGVPCDDRQVTRLADALRRRRRVALEVAEPIDDLARAVYLALPLRRRARISLATWAFGNGNRYDLVALPRLAGIALDRSYVDPAVLNESTPPQTVTQANSRWSFPRIPRRLVAAILAFLVLTILFSYLPRPRGTKELARIAAVANTPPPRPARASEISSTSQRRIEEGLVSLAERFRTLESTILRHELTAGSLMKNFRFQLTYRSKFLSQEQLAALSLTPDGLHVLAWHEHLSHFAPDRPLPANFAGGPVDWQLRVLAWSFHLDPGTRPVEEIPMFLSESLSTPFVVRSTRRDDRDPVLSEYVFFLRQLPTR